MLQAINAKPDTSVRSEASRRDQRSVMQATTALQDRSLRLPVLTVTSRITHNSQLVCRAHQAISATAQDPLAQSTLLFVRLEAFALL
jgi:uncharacterized lipoprotein